MASAQSGSDIPIMVSPVKIFPSAALPSFSRMTTLVSISVGCFLIYFFFLSECNFLDQRELQ